jgi:hypothetical protein
MVLMDCRTIEKGKLPTGRKDSESKEDKESRKNDPGRVFRCRKTVTETDGGNSFTLRVESHEP